MSANTLWGSLRALDVRPDQMTMYGFRAMARTILDEVLGFRLDFIEHQLAHAVRDPMNPQNCIYGTVSSGFGNKVSLRALSETFVISSSDSNRSTTLLY